MSRGLSVLWYYAFVCEIDFLKEDKNFVLNYFILSFCPNFPSKNSCDYHMQVLFYREVQSPGGGVEVAISLSQDNTWMVPIAVSN